ncbi:hypothetical protein Y032_0150g2754 [Ancylostoma ceylanicum]|uniref:Saposin B-type domain-containing protein n=1 Tax=Ancylostoma ceylanicum TaxID=53326 RepID=A0A016T0B9_9BILA|nr:hypothetical protein Y032_0150g2754 [Ancylostoma ceylanicum]
MLRLLAFLVLVRIAEQCSATKNNPLDPPCPDDHPFDPDEQPVDPDDHPSDSSLCRSCREFLTQLKLAAPRKLDSAVDGTRTAARDYLPFYNYVDSTIIEFLSICVQSTSRWILGCIDPRRECTRLYLCNEIGSIRMR